MNTARALYSEIDPYAAAWLRNLTAEGLIAPGDVAECSIEDLTPNDLRSYTQVHLYAGIGVWSFALRSAGWPDDRPVWTFSEPCQPFSAAGKRGGTADERYLRPATHHLVRVCRPAICFGEQVASKDGLGWLDTLQADMEGEGYAFGAFDTCSAGHGVEWEKSQAGEWLQRAIHDCPDPWIAEQLGDFADFARGNFSEGGHHIRQRLRFVAERLDDTAGARHIWPLEGPESHTRDEARLRLSGSGRGTGGLADSSSAGLAVGSITNVGRGTVRNEGATAPQGQLSGGLADADGRECDGFAELRGAERYRQDAGRSESGRGVAARCDDERLADADGGKSRQTGAVQSGGQHGQQPQDCRVMPDGRPDPRDRDGRRVDWLFCRDGKWRATRPGTLPLASNAPSRVGRLRAYGNAVDAEATIQFIEAYLDSIDDRFRLTDVSLLSANEGVFG